MLKKLFLSAIFQFIAKNTIMIEIKNSNIYVKKTLLPILCGVLTGLCNGVFGGGGGMVVVPMLTFLLKYEEKKSHATAILIILPLSILSCLLYSAFNPISYNILIPTIIGVTLGGVIGAFALSKLSNKWILITFSIIMFGAGVKLLF